MRQEVGKEVTSGIHSGGVNQFILREVLQKSLCEWHVGKDDAREDGLLNHRKEEIIKLLNYL